MPEVYQPKWWYVFIHADEKEGLANYSETLPGKKDWPKDAARMEAFLEGPLDGAETVQGYLPNSWDVEFYLQRFTPTKFHALGRDSIKLTPAKTPKSIIESVLMYHLAMTHGDW